MPRQIERHEISSFGKGEWTNSCGVITEKIIIIPRHRTQGFGQILSKQVPVGWGEAHLSQIHVECVHNESSIAFHTQYNTCFFSTVDGRANFIVASSSDEIRLFTPVAFKS
jgi:hypothetical protein